MKRSLVALVVFSFFLTSCEKKEENKELIRPVMVTTVKYSPASPIKYFSGYAQAEKFINASFRVRGKIISFPIKVGQPLKKGDLIGKLDDFDYQLSLESALASLEKAISEYRKSKAQYKRIKALYESESASRDELDTSRAAYEASLATVEKWTAEVEQQKKNLNYTILLATKDNCVVAEKVAEINENVEAYSPVAVLTCGTKLEIMVAVPESDISSIFEGQKVSVIFNVFPNETFLGTVKEVGITSSGGAAFPVTVLLDDFHEHLRSGMAVKVLISEGAEKDPVITIPIEAVGEDEEGKYVYVYKDKGNDEGIVKRRRVEIGELLPGRFVIRKGLKPKEKVVIAGLRFLYEGKKVKILKHALVPPKK